MGVKWSCVPFVAPCDVIYKAVCECVRSLISIDEIDDFRRYNRCDRIHMLKEHTRQVRRGLLYSILYVRRRAVRTHSQGLRAELTKG